MSFFFKTGKSQGAIEALPEIRERQCEVCPLNDPSYAKTLKTPNMKPSGADNPLIYCLAEAPGKDEDKKGEPLIGVSGQILRKHIPPKYMKYVRFNNCVRSRPPSNRTPVWQEIECCRPSVVKDIEETKPAAIFGLGNVPLNWMIGENGITNWRGKKMPVRIGNHTCWFFPMYHPAFVLRNQKGFNDEITPTFQRDIENACRFINKYPDPPIIIDDKKECVKGIRVVTGENGTLDIRTIRRVLDELADEPLVAIDYETNALRPYEKDARILSVAVGTSSKIIAFPIQYKYTNIPKRHKDEIWNLLGDFLKNSKCKKIAHNLTFELEWTAYFFGHRAVRDSQWIDTMAMAYVLDPRRGTLSLDNQSQIYFGFPLKKLSNVNLKKMESEKLEDLLLYNGLDTKYEFMLHKVLDAELNYAGLSEVAEEQSRRIPTLALTQFKGLHISQERVKVFQKQLGEDIESTRHDINGLDIIQKFEDQYETEYNPSSVPNNVNIFRDMLGMREGYTKEGKYTTEKKILEQIDHPLAKSLIKIRNLIKLKSTYVDSLSENGGKYLFPDGMVHPSFNAMTTNTRRLSSSGPNAQNFPSRNNKEIRGQIIAPDGYTFVACDYGQLEARVIAMASGDKKLIEALWNDYDIHMDWAIKIATDVPSLIGGREKLDNKDAMKKFRSLVKNQFVFPAFYGAGANSISENMGVTGRRVTAWLEDFWDDYTGVKDWHQRIFKFYDKNRYICLLTDFRCPAPLDATKLINYISQGTASDIVMDSMNRLSELAYTTKNWTFQPILNVHDDLSFLVKTSRYDKDIPIIIREMVKKNFDFVTVPLTVEVATGPDWYNLDEIGTYSTDELK